MKRHLALAAGVLALTVQFAPGAHAGPRWQMDWLLGRHAPAEPDSYFFDDGFEHEAVGSQDYGDYPDQPSLYDYDPGYYEPQLSPSKRRIDLVREGLRAERLKQKPAAGHSVAAKAKSPAPSKIAAAQPKLPLETAAAKAPAQAKLVLPKEKSSTANTGVSCDKGAIIVKGYGFSDVKAKSCTGEIYAFNATRGGKAYEILLSSKNGALTEVKRQ